MIMMDAKIMEKRKVRDLVFMYRWTDAAKAPNGLVFPGTGS
jgi:hypothetical protein